MNYTERKTCRACSTALTPYDVLSLGTQAIVDFVKPGEKGRGSAPLSLVLCGGCGLLQLRHTVDEDTLYRKFWYRSGINEQMRAALLDVVDSVMSRVTLNDSDVVGDIGSNDGTLLNCYNQSPEWVKRIGFEPAIELAEESRAKLEDGIVVADYFSQDIALKASGGKKYKVLTAIAMFYDLDDPVQFVRDAYSILEEEGLFVVQMNYLKMMLGNLAYDNIGHEHLCYYSLTTLNKLFNRCGFTIMNVDFNGVNGGSLRVYARKNTPKAPRKMTRVVWDTLDEEQLCFTTAVYEKFRTRVRETAEELKSFLVQLKAAGKKVYAYGASTRGSTLLQTVLGDNSEGLVIGAAERDPKKYGLLMAGLDLPIVSEEEARKDADYFLLLPYHFWETICKREKEWMAAGGKFILPLPYPEVITMSELAGKQVPVAVALKEAVGVAG